MAGRKLVGSKLVYFTYFAGRKKSRFSSFASKNTFVNKKTLCRLCEGKGGREGETAVLGSFF